MSTTQILAGIVGLGACAGIANASITSFTFTGVDGQSGYNAEADFELVNPTTLKVTVRNTSTDANGESGANIILTGIAWVMPGDITGGGVMTGATSASVGFDTPVGANANVSGEWGYHTFGASTPTGMYDDMISGNSAQMTPFGGPNLDGPAGLDGPQGGLVAPAQTDDLGGQGAINNEIVATLTLSVPLTDLSFLKLTAPRVEFGSDFGFLDGVPSPGTVSLAAIGGIALLRRRR